MKVEIVSIGTRLLMSDVLDTNSPYLSRTLHEMDVNLTCKVTVGDDPEMIADVLRVAMGRADIVLTTGEPDDDVNANTRLAVATVTGRQLLSGAPGVSGGVILGTPESTRSAFLVEDGDSALFCLPGNRREMAYLLETEVLPYIQQRIATKKRADWVMLRTVDIMESSLKQQLADLSMMARHHITYDSYAGQTNIRLWIEGESDEQIRQELEELKKEAYARLGDHIYGEGHDRLEKVVFQALEHSAKKLALVECYTDAVLSSALNGIRGASDAVISSPISESADLAAYLGLEKVTPDLDLAVWCQTAAERLLAKTAVDLGLVVYKNVTQGGIQIIVALASSHGVSVTQRSFGGHPENINQWAYTLALAHLRRWLLAHH
jgi:nicotinamide-nucleotide amidase